MVVIDVESAYGTLPRINFLNISRAFMLLCFFFLMLVKTNPPSIKAGGLHIGPKCKT